MTLALLATAAALLIWPAGKTATTRLATVSPRARRPPWSPDSRWLLVLFALPVVALLGTASATAAVLLLLAVWIQRRSRKRTKSQLIAAQAMAEALGTTVAELRGGASSAAAAEAAAADAPRDVAVVMNALASSARFGVEPPKLTGPRGQLTTAWNLSRRHGLPLADLLDAVRRDIVGSSRHLARADASMAGPRASAVVLASLPAVGVLLGEAVGAKPLHILSGTAAGHTLLMLGCAFVLAGVAWTSRLTKPEAIR
ncbi:type II secretion system F family protein [Amycolatopsis pithecellobii]|uniref:Type II secretion system protein GspF domain-containing protein n=1 Tax=Amycolatopsis pithecellobii TaxID=664692 RepID=A0A6N7ZCW5_9PSEU|nr:hypothetical protein [Amycolatopsis pithecellobii]MTD59641.1 hypothetical protein [Amycolatopsis pithecellobii]